MKNPMQHPSRARVGVVVWPAVAVAGTLFAQSIPVAAQAPVPASAPAPVAAQAPEPAPKQAPAGGMSVGGVSLNEMQARVLAIDPASNSVTVQGQDGQVVNIAVDPNLVKVSVLRVGDVLNIGYRNALLLQVEKTSSDGIRERRESTVAYPPQNGVVASARRVEVLATIQKIDPVRRQVTLRGPQRTETLDVSPDIALDKLKVGDTVRADFVSAVAVQLQSRAAQ
jgi:hypothetical protein